MTIGDYLTLIGELAIGVAGFSGVVAALTKRSAGEWRPIDVFRIQALLWISVSVAMWAVMPALLLSSGLTGPTLWRSISGSWLLLFGIGLPLQVRRARTGLAGGSSDASRALTVLVVFLLLASLSLQGANAFAVGDAWPHLTALAIGLLTALVLFLRLATVAFTPTRSAA